MRALLAVREALVRTRTRYIALVSALVRREGLPIGTGEAEHFARRVQAAHLPGHLQAKLGAASSVYCELSDPGPAPRYGARQSRRDGPRLLPSMGLPPGTGRSGSPGTSDRR